MPIRFLAAVALIVVIATWRGACSRRDSQTATWSSSSLAEGDYEFLRARSADSLELRRAGRVVSVRMLGLGAVDDPRLAPASRKWMRERLSAGTCRLEFDKRRLDGEGAYLAYVYAGDVLLNEEIVRAGLAYADSKPDDSPSIIRRIARAQAEAKAARRGIWARPDQPQTK